MSTITIVVQNCGLTGLAAIKSLNAADNKNTVRVASRDAAKLREKLSKEGAEAQVFQTGDDAMFTGADRFICIPPGGTPEPETRVTTALEFVKKATAAGATHGVVLSVVVADRRRGLFGRQWGEVEDAATAQNGVTTVFVRAPMFFGNMWGDVPAVKSSNTFYMPIDGDTSMLTAAVADVGAAMAASVLDISLGNKTVHVVGDHLTKNEIAALYSKKLGRDITFTQVPKSAATEAFKAYGMPLWQIEGVIELFDNVETDAFVDAHRGEFQNLVGRPAMTVEQYIDAALIHGLKAE
jgi:uncharacterized protein YbjT (DUF2867 family)